MAKFKFYPKTAILALCIAAGIYALLDYRNENRRKEYLQRIERLVPDDISVIKVHTETAYHCNRKKFTIEPTEFSNFVECLKVYEVLPNQNSRLYVQENFTCSVVLKNNAGVINFQIFNSRTEGGVIRFIRANKRVKDVRSDCILKFIHLQCKR